VHRARADRLEFLPGGVRTQVRPPRRRQRGDLDDGADEEPAPLKPVGGQLGGHRGQLGGHRGQHCHRRPHAHPLRRKLIAAAVLAGFLTGVVLAFVRPVGNDRAALGGLGARASADGVASATAGVRDWVLANLDEATALLVPHAVAEDLIRHGHRSGRLIVYGGDASLADWRCCRFLITVGRIGVAPGQTLPSQLQPAADRSRLLAVFESSTRRAEIREIFAADPKAARAAIAADAEARRSAAADLAENRRLNLDPAARVALLAGEVDARVLIALSGVTGKHTLAVAGFPVQLGDATTGMPRRAVDITSIDGHPIDPRDAATKDVERFLISQVPPFRPDAMPIVRDGAVRVLTIAFRAPSPIGLLAPGS
jgi:hypothetical protein